MRDEPMGDLVLVLILAVLAAVIGVGFGIFVVAPRIRRALDRAETDEEHGDRTD